MSTCLLLSGKSRLGEDLEVQHHRQNFTDKPHLFFKFTANLLS